MILYVLSLILLFPSTIECMDVLEVPADPLVIAKARLKNLGHEVRHNLDSLPSLCAAAIRQTWQCCSECLSASELVLRLPQDVRAPLNRPFVLPYAAELHSVFSSSGPTYTVTLPSMPKVITDPKGNVVVAFSSTELYVYTAWKGKPIRLILHEKASYIGSTWDYTYVVFSKEGAITLFNISKRTTFDTKITLQALQSVAAGKANALEITQNGKAVLHKNFMYGESNIDPDSYLFVIGSHREEICPELNLSNGMLYKEFPLLALLADSSAVPSCTLPLHHPFYPHLVCEIFTSYLEWQNCYNPRAMATTLDGRFLLVAGSDARYNNYSVNPLFRLDLTKLDSPQELCTSKAHFPASGMSHKVAISPDGLYALLFIANHAALPDYSEWFTQHPSVEERKQALRASHETKLVLINLETGSSFVVSEKVPIIYFGFKESGDHFYVWDGLDNVMTYTLDHVTSNLSAFQLTKILALRATRISKVDEHGTLSSECCKDFIELLTMISPWATADKDRRPVIEALLKHFAPPAVPMKYLLDYFSGRA